MLDRLKREIQFIRDEDIRKFTLNMIEITPENSWRLPSSRDHHLRDECGEWGNLIHTLRVVVICDWLSDILNLTPIERDILKSAAILHDSCKHGVNAEAAWIYREHPQLVRLLVDQSGAACSQKEAILSIIESHMGRWGYLPQFWSERKVTLNFLLHVADCLEARMGQIISIP